MYFYNDFRPLIIHSKKIKTSSIKFDKKLDELSIIGLF